MKKTIALLLAACIMAAMLAACATRPETSSSMPALTNIPASTPEDIAPAWQWVTEPTLEIEDNTPSYYAMLNFKNGMAVRNSAEGEYAVINRFGQKVTLPTGIRPHSDSYSEGLLAVSNENGQLGYVNEDGELVIDCQYYMTNDFGEGLAAVAYSADRPNGTVRGKYPQFFFIDREGNVAIDTYDWLLPIGFVRGSFNEGLIAVMYREYIFEEFREKWAYMNMDGELIGDGHCFLNATTFSEGLSLVKTDSTWGYIDTTGKLIIDLGNGYEYVPEYGASDGSWRASRFIGSQAKVKKGNDWSYIDKTGAAAQTPYNFYSADYFDTPIWPEDDGRKYYFVDAEGKELTEHNFEMVSCVSQGMAAVKVDGKWGVIEFPAYTKTAVDTSPQGNATGVRIDALSEPEIVALQKSAVGKWLDADGNLAYTINEDLTVTTRNGLSGSCSVQNGELVMQYGMAIAPNKLPMWVVSMPENDTLVLTNGENREELTRRLSAPQSGGLSAKDIEKNIVGTWVRSTPQGEEKLRFMKDGAYDATSVMSIVTSGTYYFEGEMLYIRTQTLWGTVESECTPFMDGKDSLWLTAKDGDSENYTRKK